MYAFIGSDTTRARKEIRLLVDTFSSAGTSARVVHFDEENFDAQLALEAMNEQNLFGGQNIIVLDSILSHDLGEKFYLEDLALSSNIIILRENTLKKALLVKVQSLCDIVVCDAIKTAEQKKFGDFALADAVAARDKRVAWVEFQKSKRRGEAMEPIHGMLFWAFKTMTMIATLPRTEAIASGVKAFTYSKYQAAMKGYRTEEILSHLDELKDMYHKAHRGECDLEISIEQFLLKM